MLAKDLCDTKYGRPFLVSVLYDLEKTFWISYGPDTELVGEYDIIHIFKSGIVHLRIKLILYYVDYFYILSCFF